MIGTSRNPAVVTKTTSAPRPLEQGVRADGRAEDDRLGGGRLDAGGLERVEDGRAGSAGVEGLLARRQDARLVVECDEIGEGAARVDADVEHWL